MREDAIRRAGLKVERDRLIKLGEIDEFAYPQQKKRYPRR